MALLSDIDWMILLVAAAFLLLGPQNGELLRTLGRWYGRAARLKQDLLSEFSRAADLPPSGGSLTIRGALLGIDAPSTGELRGVPAAVPRLVTAAVPAPLAPAAQPWTGGYPVPTWSMTMPVVPDEREVSR